MSSRASMKKWIYQFWRMKILMLMGYPLSRMANEAHIDNGALLLERRTDGRRITMGAARVGATMVSQREQHGATRSTMAKPCQTLFPLGAIAFYLRMDKKVFSLLSQFNWLSFNVSNYQSFEAWESCWTVIVAAACNSGMHSDSDRWWRRVKTVIILR